MDLQFVSEKNTYENKWVTYGQIKRVLANQNIDDLIRQAVELEFIDQEPGQIRFVSRLQYTATIKMIK